MRETLSLNECRWTGADLHQTGNLAARREASALIMMDTAQPAIIGKEAVNKRTMHAIPNGIDEDDSHSLLCPYK